MPMRAKLEAQFPNDDFLFIDNAWGGKPIRMWVRDPSNPVAPDSELYGVWKKPAYSGVFFDNLTVEVDAIDLETTDTVTFIFTQGESDAAREMQAVYEARLTALLSQVEELFPGKPVRFVIVQLGALPVIKPERKPHWQEIRDAQAAVAASKPNTVLLKAEGLEREAVDDIHYTEASLRTMEQQYVDATAEFISATGDK